MGRARYKSILSSYFDSERKNQIMAGKPLSRARISFSKSVIIKPGSEIGMPGRDAPEWMLLEDCWEAFLNKKHDDAVRLLPLVKRKYIIGTLFDRSVFGFEIEDRGTFFHFSVTAGWVDVAKDLVTKYNFDPEDCYKIWVDGRTLLYHATSKNHVDVVKYLIGECKCDPMTTNENGKNNVLHKAATNGLLDVLKCAINNHQCNLEATNLSGQTVLLCASGHIDIVKYLINELNCDPNATDEDGDTILHIAARRGSFDVIKYVIDHHKCNPHAINNKGETVLLCASGHIDIVKYLINKCSCDPMATDEDGNTFLHNAAYIGSLDVIEYAIDHHKCNPQAVNNKGETVLLCASEHIDVVKYLINECSCDPNATDKDGFTILHIAADIGSLDVLKYAINHHQCNPVNTNRYNKTALHYAINAVNRHMEECYCFPMGDMLHSVAAFQNCVYNLKTTNWWCQTTRHCVYKRIDIVKYLIIECNCYPMATDHNRNTVLHIAATNGLLDVLQYAINHHQCNLEATNKWHETVLHCAIEHTNVVRFLINECNCDPMATDYNKDTVLHKAARIGSIDVLKYAISHHQCNLEATNYLRETVLHRAIKHTNVNVVRFLINECNCDPMATDDYDNTVLHKAARIGSIDVLKYAISHHQCNLEATNYLRETVLHCAIEHTNAVRFLINECNCDPMATDYNGDTVLHKAATNGSLDVLKYAINHHQCNLEATNRMCETVLHCAIKHTNVVRFLINECNCNLMATDDNGDTVLHKAARIGSLNVLNYAISHHQCNLEATNKNYETVLHCAIEHTNVVRFLINECNCDPMATDYNEDTVLHKAATNGLLDVLKCAINHHPCNLEATNKNHQTVLHCAIEYTNVVRFLINECNCDPMATDDNGDTVLHKAATNGSLDVLKCAINHHQCNLEATNKKHQTVLHCAIEHTNVVRFLIDECNCDPMATDYIKNTILHIAATNGSLDVLKCAINHHQCNLEATNSLCQTVLHCAVKHISHYGKGYYRSVCNIECHLCDINTATEWDETIINCPAGHLAIVEFLIDECNADPMAFLHIAAEENFLAFMKYLIKCHYCDPTADKTILHCSIRYIDVVRFLINEFNYDPMTTDKNGQTPLHLAVSFYSLALSLAAVECLLLTGKCDPVAKDNKGRTPLEMAENRKEILDLFKKYGDIAISHPVDSYVNVLLLGNPGAGKSTLSQVIIDTATGSITLGSFKNVRGVKDCTAGIIPTKLQHKTVGNIILHDFAGHSEYYSSHGAVIENLLQGSGGVFLIVVNILEKEAVKQLHQWFSTVKVEAQKARDQCHVMVVVSHKDEIINPFERKRRMEQIQAITGEEGYDAVFLDCRKLGGSSYDFFLNEVSSFCTSIRITRGRNLSLYCHMMYGLLEERKKNVQTLSGLMSATKYYSYVLPNKKEEFLDVLYLLDSTGLISVLKSKDKVWVVVNKGILLSELNGKLFAPKIFKEHIDIASNTGIVRVSDLTKLFSDYNPDMLICFLKNMELCQELPSFLKVTNLDQLTIEGGETGERLLFFPCLLYSDNRPDVVKREIYKFGWCLQCTREHHFFPPRYFHVLSLHLAFKYALPQEDYKLNRRCTFWKNGLYWFDGRGVGVLVEIVDESQCVLVLMSCEEGYSDNMVRLRRQVIGEVVNVYKKSCSSLDVEELVIDPEKLSYPLKMPRKKIGYGAKKLMSEISNKQDYWVDETGTKQRKLKSILTDESLSDISNISILGGRDIKVKLRCTIT